MAELGHHLWVGLCWYLWIGVALLSLASLLRALRLTRRRAWGKTPFFDRGSDLTFRDMPVGQFVLAVVLVGVFAWPLVIWTDISRSGGAHG